jgi:hypothetical protein
MQENRIEGRMSSVEKSCLDHMGEASRRRLHGKYFVIMKFVIDLVNPKDNSERQDRQKAIRRPSERRDPRAYDGIGRFLAQSPFGPAIHAGGAYSLFQVIILAVLDGYAARGHAGRADLRQHQLAALMPVSAA